MAAEMGAFERLFRMMGGQVVETDAVNHVELHLLGEEPVVETLGDALAVGETMAERERAGFPDEAVRALMAQLRAAPEFMARFRATAPADEERALREVAVALLTMGDYARQRGL